ncbi:hypothetical protein EMCRGX_G015014 [Ephydatia muelleri]
MKVLYTRRKYRHLPSPKTSSFILGHLYDIMKQMKKGRGDNPLDDLILKWYCKHWSEYSRPSKTIGLIEYQNLI